MKTKTLHILLSLIISTIGYGQNLNWSWARGGGGNANDTGQTVALDAKRNFIYVAGTYNSSSITIGSQNLANNGGSDFFVAKYDTSGNVVWAKRFGGSNNDWANGIECDTATGAIYVCGTYNSSTQLGSMTLSGLGMNFYILKLDQDGVPLWTKTGINRGPSGGNNDYGNDLTVLSNGDVVMVGMYNGFHGDTLIIDNFKLLYAPLGNPAGTAGDRLLLKLNSAGTVLNATLGGGILLSNYSGTFPPNRRFMIEKDNQDNIYVATNKMGGDQNAGLDCGGVVSGATQVGGYLRNYTVYQLNSSLVQTNMFCRQTVGPRPGCTLVTGYSTEMTDMTRDINGNIFVSFKYVVYEGPGPIIPTCQSQGRGVKRIVTPGNSGTTIEKFNTPDGKMAAYNNLLVFYDTGPNSSFLVSTDSIYLYDFETQAILTKIKSPVKAQKLAVFSNYPKVVVAGYYNTSATVGSDVLPTLPGDNIVVAAHGFCPGTPPATPVITASGPLTFCQGGSVILTAPAGFNYLWNTGATTQSINVATTGNYSVTITNTSNCSATSAIIAVVVNSIPTIPTITVSGPTNFCQGGSVVLSAPAGFTYLWSTGSTSQTINVTTSGNYNVRITNASNCSSTSANTTVTVSTLPAVPVITQNGNTLTSSPATTYQWYYNGVIITGATSQSYTYTTGGDFTVSVTNAAGCSATSAIYTAMRREVVTIGSNERFSFNLFPNPVTTQLQITYQMEQTHSVGISLVNMNGRRIPIQNPALRIAGSYSVNANAVAERIWTGVYILEFTIDGQRVTRTIIKF